MTLCPGLLVAAASWMLAGQRLWELGWRAPVQADVFARELIRRVERGETAGALGLCDALDSAWAAELAARALRAQQQDRQALRSVVEELELEYAHASQRGVHVLAALQRIAIPVSLGVTILVLGGGFDGGGTSGVAAVDAERALQTALQALTIGLATWLFARIGMGVLRQQGAARMTEVRRVAKALSALDHAPGKYSA